MPSVDDYLKDNSDLDLGEAVSTNSTGDITISVFITGISKKTVEFQHMGAAFSVMKEDVISIEGTPEQAANVKQGKSALLVLNANTRLRASYTIPAADLASSLPFTMARPSAPPQPVMLSQAEAAWMANTGFQPQAAHVFSGVSVSGKDWRVDDVKGD